MAKYKCPSCGVDGETDKQDNFKCPSCGHAQHIIFRRELMDLDNPVEGALAVRIAGGMLRRDR